RLERLLWIGPFWAPEMGEQNHLAALVGNLADGRGYPLDGGRVGDLAVLDRHVEIGAHEPTLAPHVGLTQRAEHVSRLRARSCEPKSAQRRIAHCRASQFRLACPSQPRCRPSGWRSPIRCRTTTSPAPACRPSPWSGRSRTPTSAHRG